jgi:hypothetical protein
MADLRRKQPAPAERPVEPPARRTVNMPRLKGTIPFDRADIILTEAEKKFLKEQVGWKEGDPIPQLSKVIKAEVDGKLVKVGTDRSELLKGIKTLPPDTYPEDTPNFQPPAVIAVENLSPEKRQEIEDAIKAMKQHTTDTKAAGNLPFIPRDPSIGQAATTAQQQNAEYAAKIRAMQQQAGEAKVEDDRKAPERPKAKITRTQSPPPAPPQPEPPRQQQVPPPDTVEQSPGPVAAPVAGTRAEQKLCQHCGWDQSKQDVAEVTAEDLKTFVASILGGQRFVKAYNILGGALQIIFRGMTSKEADRILRQLYIDGKAGRISSLPEATRKAQEYQLAVCLQSIHSETNALNLPPIDQHELDEDATTTGLPEVVDYVYEQALCQESLRRIAMAIYSEFDNTLAKLEASAKRSDFLQAIAN